MSTRSDTPGSSSSAPSGSKAPHDAPIVHDVEPGKFLFGSYKNVLIAVWESQGTAQAVERMGKVIHAVASAHPEGRSNIHVIVEGAALPEAEVRASFVQLMKQNAEQLACVAVVAGGTGFWVSAFRSFVTGLRWLVPRSFDLRLHGTIEEVVRSLPAEHQKRTGVALDPDRLLEVLVDWSQPSKHSAPAAAP